MQGIYLQWSRSRYSGQETVGNRTRARVVKNKMAPPFKEAEFDIMYGEGISRTGDLLDMGVEAGVIEKSGSWDSYGGERMGQGRERVKQFFIDNSDIYTSLFDQVKDSMGLSKSVKETDGEPGEASAP